VYLLSKIEKETRKKIHGKLQKEKEKGEEE